MPRVRRTTRPQDRRLGTVYGEMLRPVFHSEGPHAGYTLVEVRHPRAAAILQADGWAPVADAPAEVTPPPPPVSEGLAARVGASSVTEVVQLLVPGLTRAAVAEALAAEGRPVLAQLLQQYLDDGKCAPEAPAPAPKVVPPKPRRRRVV